MDAAGLSCCCAAPALLLMISHYSTILTGLLPQRWGQSYRTGYSSFREVTLSAFEIGPFHRTGVQSRPSHISERISDLVQTISFGLSTGQTRWELPSVVD